MRGRRNTAKEFRNKIFTFIACQIITFEGTWTQANSPGTSGNPMCVCACVPFVLLRSLTWITSKDMTHFQKMQLMLNLKTDNKNWSRVCQYSLISLEPREEQQKKILHITNFRLWKKIPPPSRAGQLTSSLRKSCGLWDNPDIRRYSGDHQTHMYLSN